MVPIFRGMVIEGKPVLAEKSRFRAWCRRFEQKEFELILRRPRKDRSSKQNRWYWGQILPLMADALGYEIEEVHNALKQKFLSSNPDEALLPRIRSTATLSTIEFSAYVERCRQLAAELGVIIPDPGECE